MRYARPMAPRWFLLLLCAPGCGATADHASEPHLDAAVIADTAKPDVATPPTADTSVADTGRTPLPTDPVEVSIGYGHICARTRDGHVRCWGSNVTHELGDGTTEHRKTPVEVRGLSNVVQIAAGHYNSCARIADGTVKCWGQLGDGQTGDGRSDARLVIDPPMQIPKLSNVVSLPGGSSHKCALLSDRSLMCWGFNPFGELGYATTTPAFMSDGYTLGTEPATVPGLTGVRSVSTGVQHTCALTEHGVWCWGWNERGQLGDGTTTSRYEPRLVAGLTDVVQLSAHHSVSCALRSTGAVMCWGALFRDNFYEHAAKITAPYQVKPFAGPVAEVVAGGSRSCVRLKDGRVQCWGAKYDDMYSADAVPVLVKDLDRVVQLAVANGRTCALRDDATIWCWGALTGSYLGDEWGSTYSSIPLKVAW
jgi:alpha-tubulin suppressor-like RCC1 family protein